MEMEDLKMAMQIESVGRCTAERCAISAVCDFYKDDVNEEEFHRKIRQFLAGNVLNCPTPNKRCFETVNGNQTNLTNLSV